MTHLPYIAASYGLALGVILWLGIGAWSRTRAARARLAAIDPRGLR
jgi:heme exporter protein D